MRLCAIKIIKGGGRVQIYPQFKAPSGAVVSWPSMMADGTIEKEVVKDVIDFLIDRGDLKE